MVRVCQRRATGAADRKRSQTADSLDLALRRATDDALEQALHREVAEEVGIQIRNPRYFASQSWPFPHSRIIAFTAEYAGSELQVDGRELIDARWFALDAPPGLPRPMGIAWRLIQDFLTGGGDMA